MSVAFSSSSSSLTVSCRGCWLCSESAHVCPSHGWSVHGWPEQSSSADADRPSGGLLLSRLRAPSEFAILLMVVCRRVRLVCEEVLLPIDSFWLFFNHRVPQPRRCRPIRGVCLCPVGSGPLRWCHLYLFDHVLFGLLVANGSKEPPTASENRLHEGQFCL